MNPSCDREGLGQCVDGDAFGCGSQHHDAVNETMMKVRRCI